MPVYTAEYEVAFEESGDVYLTVNAHSSRSERRKLSHEAGLRLRDAIEQAAGVKRPDIIATLVDSDMLGDEEETEDGYIAGDLILTCPVAGCASHEFFEVDESVRHNEVMPTISQHDGAPMISIHQGDGSYDTTHFECGNSHKLNLPDAYETEVSWS